MEESCYVLSLKTPPNITFLVGVDSTRPTRLVRLNPTSNDMSTASRVRIAHIRVGMASSLRGPFLHILYGMEQQITLPHSPWINFAERNKKGILLGAMARNCHCAFKIPYQYHNWTQRWYCDCHKQHRVQPTTSTCWDTLKTSQRFSSMSGNPSGISRERRENSS
jgi:hypothetical protein